MERIIAAIDGLNERIGAWASIMTFGTAFVCFATVFLRYALNTSFTWLVEAYIWQHLLVILIGAGFTFKNGGFVRVDLFYAKMSARGRAWVDLLGFLIFLLPFMACAWVYSWTFVAQSWAIWERSPQADGLPGIYLIKSAMLACYLLLTLQGLAIALRSLLVLRGREEFSPGVSGH